MVNSSQGDEPRQVEESFADKDDWTQLDPAWLDQAPDGWASALAFFSDEAIRFFIPAYLVADLRGSLTRVDPTYPLTDGLEDGQLEELRARWGGLTQGQVNAIVQYLEWRLQREPSSIEIAGALKWFWHPRATDPDPTA
jgi:hypothetical protein